MKQILPSPIALKSRCILQFCSSSRYIIEETFVEKESTIILLGLGLFLLLCIWPVLLGTVDDATRKFVWTNAYSFGLDP